MRNIIKSVSTAQDDFLALIKLFSDEAGGKGRNSNNSPCVCVKKESKMNVWGN